VADGGNGGLPVLTGDRTRAGAGISRIVNRLFEIVLRPVPVGATITPLGPHGSCRLLRTVKARCENGITNALRGGGPYVVHVSGSPQRTFGEWIERMRG
jgi:hypothetical protein